MGEMSSVAYLEGRLKSNKYGINFRGKIVVKDFADLFFTD